MLVNEIHPAQMGAAVVSDDGGNSPIYVLRIVVSESMASTANLSIVGTGDEAANSV